MNQPATAVAAEEFSRLIDIMDRLRAPGGCPWDREQTHESLVRYLIEESYEVVEAIESTDGVDFSLLREELGDVLLQVVFHARVAQEAERGGFGIADVVRGLNEKLLRRHPHVFTGQASPEGEPGAAESPGRREGSGESGDAAPLGNAELEDLTRRWDEIKRAEKPERRDPFDGIPPALPALALAEKTLNKAAKASLPLPDERGHWSGSERADGPSSASETTAASQVSPESVAPGSSEAEEELLGHELLGLVAAARRRGVDPEKALRRAVREFTDSSRGIT
ncbi:MazG nucleotide pyrophosphohydrolase domain-containing protein [uncultured Kocuria sp.]|uniref:MazG nucleotide pyrophosphohydrolase domain-containing protein n=1 Tax=uncultured Kocuria sp. TaxID=259305 RepID=UPI002591FC79|nr:MazG nucleotide pyrophosphohydrolase domain-containing protein [uncultured Kocuria sp.]MCT1366464.1 nucleoside triphosphate pyrophosphohydrolase [Rothia sp. p3-SID1597]